MNLKCFLGLHTWDRCKCQTCGRVRDQEHNWSTDCEKCTTCGTTRLNAHRWGVQDCDKCGTCGTTRSNAHDWSKDCEKCAKCGRASVREHRWSGCKCAGCAKTRDREHNWSKGYDKCAACRAVSKEWVVRYREGSRYVYIDSQSSATVNDPRNARVSSKDLQDKFISYLHMDSNELQRRVLAFEDAPRISTFQMSRSELLKVESELMMAAWQGAANQFRELGIASPSQLGTAEAVPLAQAAKDWQRQMISVLAELQNSHSQAQALKKKDAIRELIDNRIPKLTDTQPHESVSMFSAYRESINSSPLIILRACSSERDLQYDLGALLEDYSVHVEDHYSVVVDAENRIASVAVHNKGSANGRVMNVFVWREAKLYRFIGQPGTYTDSTGLTVGRPS